MARSPRRQTATGRRELELGLWPLRVGWLVLPLAVGPVLAAALARASTPVRLLAEITAWAIWFAAIVATLVPHPVGLTLMRLAGPTLVAATAWAVVVGRGGERLGDGARSVGAIAAVIALCASVAVGALSASAPVADRLVDGASYGPERRFALRAPGSLLLGPLPLAWLATAVGLAAGPALIAAGRPLLGAAVVLVGWPVAAVSVRAVHGLSARWLVFVPAGFVLHDRAALMEPVLVERHRLEQLGPAQVGTHARDLTLGAFGLVLEARLAEPLDMAVRSGRRTADTVEVTALLFSPLRPGAVLREAAARHLRLA